MWQYSTFPRPVEFKNILGKLAIALLGVSVAAGAQESPATPPAMDAQQLSSTPTIDGDVLGDSAWSGVTPATGFWQIQPDDGQPATQRTEVYVGFSNYSLYVGVVAYDDEPDAIIVTDSRRDSSLGSSSDTHSSSPAGLTR